MSVVFDPFTGQIIDTGSSGGSPTIGGPVLGADPNAILVTDGATNLADIQLADGQVLIGKTGDAPVAATLTGTADQVIVTNGPNTITLSTPQDIATTSSPTFANLNLTPTAIIDVTTAGLLEIGVTNATVINIGNAGADVNIYGDTVYQNVTNLNVTDKNITVNNGGSPYTSFNAGIHVYDGGIADKGYLEVTPDMLGWDMKAPYADGVIVFNPGSTGFTINQGSHNPITIATPANGLAVDVNQELSIELASSIATGALSFTDWNTFNNKQDALIYKIKAYDPVNTTLPSVDPTIIDGYTVLNGDSVLFSNLSNPVENNKIYIASISSGVITWTEDTSFVPNVNDYVLVENGTAFAIQAGVFNGTSFDFNRVVRYFNGVDYFEQSAIYAVSLANNSANTVFTINVANSENMVVDYSILRGANKTTGTLYITTDGVFSQVSDVGVNLYSPVGVFFSTDIVGGQIILYCNTDNSGDNGELKYNLRRWSDAPGGPGGLPSYSGSGGSSTITIEEVSSVNPTVPFSNINTIQFDNDTGFNVTQPSPGTVKVSLGSTFKTWNIDNGAGPVQPSLVAVGEDAVEFIAGTNVEFVTDNTLGSKSFTINATGGGPTTETRTLNNNASNEDVTGFIVDPLVSDAFSADIVIKREVPTGIVDKNPAGYAFSSNRIIELSDGSCILYTKGGVTLNKVASDGTVDTTFQTNVNQFSSSGIVSIDTVIDVTEDISNQVFVVFGSFDTFQSLSRNNVCFIDGNGNDISDLYLNFGNATGSGTGISVSMTSYTATKIKIPAAAVTGTWTASTRYGYLIQGVTGINGTSITNQAIVVSNEQSGGYIELSDPVMNFPNARLFTPSDKSVGTCSFTYGATTLPAINWADAESFYYAYISSSTIQTIQRYDFVSGTASTVAVATNGPFSFVPVSVNSIATNPDGSVLFFGGEFDFVDSINNRSFAKIIVNSPTSFTFDSAFSPFYPSDTTATVYKILVSPDFVYVSGYIQNAYPANKNYLIYDYSGNLNTAALTIFNNIFQYDIVHDFTTNLFIQNPPGVTKLYGYSAASPVVYMTTMFGCYDESIDEMVIQGYTKSAGPYTGVDFSMTPSGQLKYNSTNNVGGGSFTMKYKLETI